MPRDETRVRKVYYVTERLARATPVAAAMLGENVSEFITHAILDRMASRLTDEQRRVLFPSDAGE